MQTNRPILCPYFYADKSSDFIGKKIAPNAPLYHYYRWDCCEQALFSTDDIELKGRHEIDLILK